MDSAPPWQSVKGMSTMMNGQVKRRDKDRRSLLYFSAFLMMILLMISGKAQASADTRPVITVTPRVSTAQVGDTVTFDYSVTGISQYQKIFALISYYADEDLSQYGGAKSVKISGLSGSFSYTVTAGYGVKATIYLTDTLGQSNSADSSVVRISSFTAPDPVITVTPRVSTARIGDTVTFDYSITGLDSYQQLFALVSVYGDEELSQYSDAKSYNITSLSGSFSYTVTAGFGIKAEIYLKDLISNSYTGESSIVRITNFSTPDPVITVTPRVSTGKVGDTVTFDYWVTDVDSYRNLIARIYLYRSENTSSPTLVRTVALSGLTGSFTYSVSSGAGVYAELILTDNAYEEYTCESSAVQILPLPEFTLPGGLMKIEEEAEFSGV